MTEIRFVPIFFCVCLLPWLADSGLAAPACAWGERGGGGVAVQPSPSPDGPAVTSD